ncbi:TetR/AcrR family transcriptional regulator [Streptomyces sp. NPDC052396]|uniref:TetR/AcrR family transcriptional regulator n=1 Tax=Streptomyces sp. NPDC052396 TaxID=3365689 RepID=UPI0037CDEE61
MSAIRGARERARDEIVAAIKEEARRQLARDGAAKLSLRAVARELGMVSSALYRYFPSRDELLTALIVDAYDAVGARAEAALAAAGPADPAARWAAVCGAVREWALDHPHEYALIYGSPVPGYQAPEATIEPAGRVALALVAIARDAHAAGQLKELPVQPAPVLCTDLERLTAEHALGLPAPVAAALVASWAQLFGLIGFELFGQFNNVVEAREAFFAHSVRGLAHQIGIADPEAAPAGS